MKQTPSESVNMSVTKPVRKAVFPVAGMGTRFLPATKAVPKEMLPEVDKAVIQYAAEEAREQTAQQARDKAKWQKEAIDADRHAAFEYARERFENANARVVRVNNMSSRVPAERRVQYNTDMTTFGSNAGIDASVAPIVGVPTTLKTEAPWNIGVWFR